MSRNVYTHVHVNALLSAGFERPQAEAIVSMAADMFGSDVVTKDELTTIIDAENKMLEAKFKEHQIELEREVQKSRKELWRWRIGVIILLAVTLTKLFTQ